MPLLTISKQLLELLRDRLERDIKTFYDGKLDPANIANIDLPVLTVENVSHETLKEGEGTVKDNMRWHFRLVLWLDRKMYIDNKTGESEEKNTVREAMEAIVNGLDVNMDYRTDTIYGVLRKQSNLSIAGKVFYTHSVRTDYEDYIDEKEYQLAKATIEFDAERRVTRPS